MEKDSDNKKITGRIMKVYMSVGTIPATVKDIKLTNDTLKANESSVDGGEWRTRLWGKKNRKYRNLVNSISKARAFLKEMTLASDVRGERILKTTAFMDVKTKMKMLEEQYWDCVRKFLSDYDAMVKQEVTRLADLAINVVFPTKEQLESKFRFDIWFGGIPEGDDLVQKYGLELPLDEVRRIAEKAEEKTKQQVAKAMLETWRRVFNTVYDMAVKLAEEDYKFRDSLVGNIRSLVGLMPHLNLTDDPQLEEIRELIEEKLLVKSATELKKDPEARKEVAKSALEISTQMATIFGDGGGNGGSSSKG